MALLPSFQVLVPVTDFVLTVLVQMGTDTFVSVDLSTSTSSPLALATTGSPFSSTAYGLPEASTQSVCISLAAIGLMQDASSKKVCVELSVPSPLSVTIVLI